MKSDARHSAASTLALLSGGDLPWRAALSARWHLRLCQQCAREFAVFRAARQELRLDSAAGSQPAPGEQAGEFGPAWNSLEAEMRANIRLGLAAGSLASGSRVDAPDGPAAVSSAPWRWAAVGAASAFVLIAGWSLRSPGGWPAAVASAPIREGEAPFGEPAIQGARIQLLVPVADVSRTETEFDGSTRSRMIDGETGQVTLQQIYVE